MAELAGWWHDYFMTVGAGAAALTGLVFVAMTLHLEDITKDPVHRHPARTILIGLTAVFIRCALVLMGGGETCLPDRLPARRCPRHFPVQTSRLGRAS